MVIKDIILKRKVLGNQRSLFGILEIHSKHNGIFYFSTVENNDRKIREVDAIAHVVRCFKDENITHVSENIDPLNDIETINTELQLADIETLENKKNSLATKSKQGDKEILHQIKLIEKIIENLNDLSLLQNSEFTEEDNEFIQTLNIIAIKPMLYICNVDEESVQNGNEMSRKVSDYANEKNHNTVIVSASIESQIAELENNDEKLIIKNLFLIY